MDVALKAINSVGRRECSGGLYWYRIFRFVWK